MALYTSSSPANSCISSVSGLDFIVFSGVGTVGMQKFAHILRISSLSDVISPDSFLKLIIICLFLCLLICLGPFLASNVSIINSFLFLCALVLRFFFTNLLSSAYSTLSFSVLFVFCLNSFLFLSTFSISVSSILFFIVDFCVLCGVHRFSQNCVHFLYR